MAKKAKPNTISWQFPIRGINQSGPYRSEMGPFSPEMANVRSWDVIEDPETSSKERRLRGGQRGGYEVKNEVPGAIVDMETSSHKDASGGAALCIVTTEGVNLGFSPYDLEHHSLDLKRDVRVVGLSGVFYLFPTDDFSGRKCEYKVSSWSLNAWDAHSGDIPETPQSVCSYRERLVVGGTEESPFSWYMSRVGDTSDWDYGESDATAAARGTETGDNLVAVIPVATDHLVLAGKNSLRVLSGDPMAGGSIELVSKYTGVYSWISWCVDQSRRVYFTDGYDMFRFGTEDGMENISESVIPRMFQEMATTDNDGNRVDEIDMSYDPQNAGVYIVQSSPLDNKSKGWFYDIQTQGFFPDVYGKQDS